MTIFLDTSILVYSISTAEDEIAKRNRAIQLLDRADCVLSVQVLQEFYVQATRTSRRDPLSHETVAPLTRAWCRFPVQENSVALFQAALELRRRTRFSLWDCTIIAAAHGAGCRDLYSEDMSHGRKIDGLRIVNPFRGL